MSRSSLIEHNSLTVYLYHPPSEGHAFGGGYHVVPGVFCPSIRLAHLFETPLASCDGDVQTGAL